MNNKRQLLTDTALQLFYQRGIHAVGINEILAQAGVAKKTLYHHFDSKEALLLATLEQRHEVFTGWLQQQLSDTQAQTNIRQLFNALQRWFNNKEAQLGEFNGCFFINTSAEFSDPDSVIGQRCRAHKQRVKQLIRAHCGRQQQADTVYFLMEGAIVAAHTGGQRQAARHCLTLLQSQLAEAD